MPAPQLHLTFANSLHRQTGVPAAMRLACASVPVYARLGAIIHDLPYYGNMLLEAIRYGLETVPLDEPWAYRVHSVRPARFVASFVRAAATVPGLEEHERLALLGGLMSHCALDLELHPLVNLCARRATIELGGHEQVHHRLTEKYHSLFFHIARHGRDPIGSRELARQTRVTHRSSLLRPCAEWPAVAVAREAYRGAYGGAPTAHQWRSWVRNFGHFGELVSTPFAARNSRRVRHDGEAYARYFENHEFSFWDYYARAEQRLVELTTLAYDYFRAGDFGPDAEARFCLAAEIDDLAEPQPRRSPAIAATSGMSSLARSM